MRHELVHVLQQTGPRPPGSDDAPQIGEPGLGVKIDPRAEKIASEISAQGSPGGVSPLPTRGFQPDMFGMGSRFVDYLTHVERAKREIDRIEDTKGGTGRKLIGQEVREDVAEVGNALNAWIDAFSVKSMDGSVTSTFSPVADKIKKWLQERKVDISNAIEDLAIDSSETQKLRDDTTETPVMKLGVLGFQFKLVRFIVVATGCDIKIELHHGADGKLDRAKPLKHATFEGMNLAIVPYAGAGKDLWDELMKNTFPTSASDVNVRAHTRILLFALGFGDKPWDAFGGFKLHSQLAAQIEREAMAVSNMTLPEASTFWHGTTRPSNTAQPALWIGKHGDATHHDQPDRQSHHTTQYLLVQYFEQKHATVQPFPTLKGEVATTFEKLMNFTLSGTKVDAVGDIAVGTLDPKSKPRGAEMPALLMSAVAHRRGRLHVQPITDAEKEADDVPSTQGGRIHNWFMEALTGVLGKQRAADYWTAVKTLEATAKPAATGTTLPRPDIEPLDWMIINAPALTKALPAAMKYVYVNMRDVMIPAILPALQTLERTWYEQLALARQKSIDQGPYHVTDAMVFNVANAASNNNRTIMEGNSKWA